MAPQQVDSSSPQAEMPPYMESLLAHLRLLVGVPFEYLVPDSRLLPDESIRFFYLDRSWTDRLVDGAIAVGKMGTREQAHHQAHAQAVSQQVDLSERIVRKLQRGNQGSFGDLKANNDNDQTPANVITGFLLRSAAVSGWPHMDVRSYSTVLPENFDPADPANSSLQLRTLRLELLTPSIMLALFEGIPALVILEEPHHGVQFGVNVSSGIIVSPLLSGFGLNLRLADGEQIPGASIPVPVRSSNNRVIHVTALRKSLYEESLSHSGMPSQEGSADFATEVLNPPWQQRFVGTQDQGGGGSGSGAFVAGVNVGVRITYPSTSQAWRELIGTQE